jgi:putative ABC transport system permease protein
MRHLAVLSLREAVRALSRQRSVFVVAILTLGLGLSLSTAILCVLYNVLLRPLSYGDPQRLVIAWAAYEGGATERDSFGEQSIVAWRQSARAFESVAGFRYTTFTLLQRGEPTDVEGAFVSPELFSVFTIQPAAGAVFTPAQATAQQGKVAVISRKLWRQRFADDPQVAGKPINLGGEIYTITGVLPDDFEVPSAKTAVWVPLPQSATGAVSKSRALMVVARVRPSVMLAQAQAEADILAQTLAKTYPDTNRGMRIRLLPFFNELIDDSRQLIILGTAAALLTLLICCANVSNLLLVRAIARRGEFATRLAMGAGRRHLLAVVFSESLWLVLGGGLIAVAVSRWMIAALIRLSPVNLPRAQSIGADWQIPIAATLLVIVAALLVTIPAAWEASRSRPAPTATLGVRSTSRLFARQLIVAIEIAIALTLVAGSGLMVRTMLALRDTNPGWKSDHLLVTTVVLPRKAYREPHQQRQFFTTFLERLRARPEAVSVAASTSIPVAPIGADFDVPIQVPGDNSGPLLQGQAAIRMVSPGLFKTLGIPVLQGRDFDDTDGLPTTQHVVVNQAFVKKHLAGTASPLGRQIVILFGAPKTYEIVGVVGDVHHYGILQTTKPEFYLSYAHRPFVGMGVVVRTSGDPTAFAPTLYKVLWSIDPTLAVASTATMEDMVSDTWNDRTLLTIVMLAFSAIVAMLTIVGVFSVVTFSVSRQVREIAIHMAVGARKDDVLRLIMWQTARPVIAGIALGLAGAWLLGRGLANLLYGVSAADPRVLFFGVIGVMLVAALGAYLPSRRAANIDPMLALRLE